MSDFISFCRAHGIIINSLPPLGVWRRYPTDDHPRKRNGAVKFMGDHAFIQNWAVSTSVNVWKTDAAVDVSAYRRDVEAAERKRRQQQESAAKRAAWIMHQTQIGKHPYLEAKGFADEQGSVWKQEDRLLLVIPMRIGQRLVGCQLIDETGDKKFLFGQRTANAEFVFDNKGPHVLCEGYATALSLRRALKNLQQRYTLHVCFSAGNMEKLSRSLPGGLVVADNDASETGEKVAKAIGWPYFMPPDVGDDFNDFATKVGAFRASQSLRPMVNEYLRKASAVPRR